MIEINIPGRGSLKLSHLVLDVSGTIACDGTLIPGVTTLIRDLQPQIEVHLLTADTHQAQDKIDRELGITGARLKTDMHEAEQKAEFIRGLGREEVVAIGNGANDALMLKEAALGMAVLGQEGVAIDALQSADLLTGNILDALDMLLHPRRLIGTLRR
ncbi:MAG: HAD family hydrolase [Chloroflexota bacterium]|nr:HAD family hydrolase [Chloroflexota bacterium]